MKLSVACILLFLLVGAVQYHYDSRFDYHKSKDIFLSLPSGKTLRILSFGFDNIFADMIFIYSIQLYASPTLRNRYDYVERIFNTITDLTPQYLDPYIVGGWIFALELNDPKRAIKLLQKGAKENSDEWILDFESADYAKNYLGDFKLAEKFYKKAAENSQAPPFIRRNYAHMVFMQKDLQRAKRIWVEIYQNADSHLAKESAFNHLYQIKFIEDRKVLTQCVQKFKGNFGRFPINLHELVKAKLLVKVPLDFSERSYLYDADTGIISARKVLEWKK